MGGPIGVLFCFIIGRSPSKLLEIPKFISSLSNWNSVNLLKIVILRVKLYLLTLIHRIQYEAADAQTKPDVFYTILPY